MALSVKYIAFSSLAVAVHLIAGCGDAPQALVADEVAEPKSEPSSSSDQAIEPVKFDRDGLDWPQFLGPDGTGITREEGELLTLDEQAPPIRWQLDVGEGYSAPAVRGRRLVLHHRIRNEEIIDCLDAATGERIWRHVDATDFRDPYGYNGGPRCSPLLTESHCYTFGAGGLLTCLELESGETVWQINTAKRYDVPEAFFGVGCTPVLHDDLLIVLVGGQPDYGVVAFNARRRQAHLGRREDRIGGDLRMDRRGNARQLFVADYPRDSWSASPALPDAARPRLTRPEHG